MEHHLQSLCVLFSSSLSILSIVQFKPPSIILLSYPSFFAYNFLVLQKSVLLVLYPEGAQTESSIIIGSNLKGHKPPFSIGVNLSDTFKTQMKQKKHSICVAISRKERDGAQSIISRMVCLIMVDMSFS